MTNLKTEQDTMKLFKFKGTYNCFVLAQVLNTSCHEEQGSLAHLGFIVVC